MAIMGKLTAILFLWIGASSCFLSGQYRKTSFMYTVGTQSYSFPILVPKGYTKERTEVDSSGNTILSYLYGSKTTFYIAHLEDTSRQLLPFMDKAMQLRKDSVSGTVVYKGVDADKLFWKEIRRSNFRTGYHSVPEKREALFDSATNYCAAQALSRSKF